MKKILFSGCCTALITPFKNGKVDYECLKNLLLRQIVAGVDAVCVLGTTGEPCTLQENEKMQIIELAKDIVGEKTKLIVGTGSNDTKRAIEFSKMACEKGADGLLVVTPYYNKCTQIGLFDYYSKIAKAVDLPIIAYNVPGRTGVNIEPTTAVKICKIKNVVGIKEASGNIVQIINLISAVKDEVAVYSGDDFLNYVFLALGAKGVISVASNMFPKKMKMMCDFAAKGDLKTAFSHTEDLHDVYEILKCDLNPQAVKCAMSQLGLCQNELRSPLCKSTKKIEENIKNFLSKPCKFIAQ